MTIELSDATFAALQQHAQTSAKSPAQLAATALEQRFGANHPLTEAEKKAADEQFQRLFAPRTWAIPPALTRRASTPI